MLVKSFFHLRCEFESKSVQALSEIADILQKVVVENDGGDGRAQSSRGGNERLGDAGSNSAKAGGTGAAEARKGIDDAPYGSEKADEGSHRAGGSQPGHAFFDAADLVGGGKLHADRDS